MGKYANNTTVSPEKSQNDIRDTLRRYGAKKFGVMEEDDKAHVMFEYSNLMIQISITLPKREEFDKTETGRERKNSLANEAYNQAIRQHWRSLLLAIKAKLEAVECHISTIEQEFMAFVIMPDGRNLGEHIIPKLKDMSATGKMPKLLGFMKD